MVDKFEYIKRKLPLLKRISVFRTLLFRMCHHGVAYRSLLIYPKAVIRIAPDATVMVKNNHCKLHVGCPNYDKFPFETTKIIMGANTSLTIAGQVMMESGSELTLCDNATLHLNGGVHIGRGARIMVSGNSSIGRDTWISENVHIEGSVNIPDNMWIGVNETIKG